MGMKGLETDCVVVQLLPTYPVSARAQMNFKEKTLPYVFFMRS